MLVTLPGHLSHFCLRFCNSAHDGNTLGFRNIHFLLDHNWHRHLYREPLRRGDILLLRNFDRYGDLDWESFGLGDVLFLLNNDRYWLDLGENLCFLLDTGIDHGSSEIVCDGACFRLRTRILCASNWKGPDLRLSCCVCAFDREWFRNRNGDCFYDRVWLRNSERNLLGNKIRLFDNTRLDSCMSKDFSCRFRRTWFGSTSHSLRHGVMFRNSALYRNFDGNGLDDGLKNGSRDRDFLDTWSCNCFHKGFGQCFRAAILPEETLGV